MWLFTLEIGAEQLRCVTDIASKSRFLCVNRGPVWYGFRASAKAPIDVKLKYSTVLQKSFSGS